ncbi:glycosyltransferase [Iodidimonas sp. SYSU 1G8]|uniref:glycosyltransferase family 32 protein n=1 Tax=Iodidimonas sp. SYSU 1G8 TaxID=3133967 RepID=UPI0031FED493
MSRLNQADWAGALPVVPEGDRVPRIIHQTFPDKTLPPALRVIVDALRDGNPGWEHRLYDDRDVAEFIGHAYGPAVLDLFNRLDPSYGAARADLFRYLLMYRMGGVYLDIKSGSHVPLDTVLRPGDRFLLSHWGDRDDGARRHWGSHRELTALPGGEFEQWYIACAPGHPFLRAVILRVLRNIECYEPLRHGVARKGVLRVTGPIAYSLAIAPLLDRAPHRRWVNHGEDGLVYTMVDAADDMAHEAFFATHYSHLTRPIVRCGPVKTAAVETLMRMKKTIKRWIGPLRRRLRPTSGPTPSR